MTRKSKAKTWLVTLLFLCVFAQTMIVGVPTASGDSAVTYRALLIGNNEYERSPLKGCVNDAKALKAALSLSTSIRYGNIALQTDLSAEGLAAAIHGLWKWGIDDNDVTLVYYSGHGYRESASGETGLVGVDMRKFSFGMMEQLLRPLRGKVILLIDSCYSGGVIGKSSGSGVSDARRRAVSAYNRAVVEAFHPDAAQSKALSGDKYHVVTAASGRELSFEEGGFGYFTTGLTEAMGWSSVRAKKLGALQGDADQNGVLTVGEAYAHARGVVRDFRESGDQNVQISPGGSALPLVGWRASAQMGEAVATEPDGAPSANRLLNLPVALLAPGQMHRLNGGSALTWRTTNPSVATVSVNGLVVARARGKAVIVGLKGSNIAVYCTVGVVAPAQAVQTVALRVTRADWAIGAKGRLTAAVRPATALRKGIAWRSSNPAVVAVAQDGRVLARGEGVAQIYAVSSSGAQAVCVVNVAAPPVRLVQHRKSHVKMRAGQSGRMLARALPLQAKNRALVWSSSDPSIAQIDRNTGSVIAKKPGRVFIAAAATDGSGVSSRCLLSVYPGGR